jgi:biotin carboxyl carrier protein
VDVRAQLSASVWQVKVAPGQQVVEAERGDVVREVLVKPDDLVQHDDPLVTLDPL